MKSARHQRAVTKRLVGIAKGRINGNIEIYAVLTGRWGRDTLRQHVVDMRILDPRIQLAIGGGDAEEVVEGDEVRDADGLALVVTR